MATLPTATSRARASISRCLTWGVVLVTIGYAGQAFAQSLVNGLPLGFGIVVATLLGLVKVAGPAVLAVGIVGVGVQLGLAAYGVRPAVQSGDRADQRVD